MTQTYRRYRQVNVVKRANGVSQVRGMEEMSVNGHRQVRYFGDPEWERTGKKSDDLLEDWLGFDHQRHTENLFGWLMARPFSVQSAQDFLVPSDVILDPQNQPDKPALNRIHAVKEGFSHRLHKAQRIFRNVPQALKAAWTALNQ